MTLDVDRLAKDVACLNVADMPFTLVSRLGFYCDVWRSIGRLVTGEGSVDLDFVLKVAKRRFRREEVTILRKEYLRLREGLDDIVPESLFVATEVDGVPGAVVLARACRPWFDLANPTNEEEARAIVGGQPRARSQLRHFVRCARRWVDEDRMLIDLQGGENLVLDSREGVRYLDSFHVFFYLDMLDVIPEVDSELQYRIDQSLARLDYLESLAGLEPSGVRQDEPPHRALAAVG